MSDTVKISAVSAVVDGCEALYSTLYPCQGEACLTLRSIAKAAARENAPIDALIFGLAQVLSDLKEHEARWGLPLAKHLAKAQSSCSAQAKDVLSEALRFAEIMSARKRFVASELEKAADTVSQYEHGWRLDGFGEGGKDASDVAKKLRAFAWETRNSWHSKLGDALVLLNKHGFMLEAVELCRALAV